MRLALVLMLSLLAGCASLAPADPEPPPEFASIPYADPDAGFEPPKVIRRVDPVPPPGFVRREANAQVEAVINEKGRVDAVWIVWGDPVWARAVADAVKEWTFEPATKDGEPVATRFRLTSKFTLH